MAYSSSAASLIDNLSSFTGFASASASGSAAGCSTAAGAGASSSIFGAGFFAAFFGAGFLFLALGAAFGFLPEAFSCYAFLTSSTDLPDLSSSITSYNIDSCTPSYN
jgi:hypothetical protein